ncbi:O-succinylbenzoate synthase [Leucobacter exalbidus]|uniref:o-succinylbenzoate synthase n=1 Tax=Leucobacter exalbidus TaxID=662960 RepID=A0A940PXA8_9MICO|nr:o-succinylbenzoate synthase [Leucobacter exalbidus]MBP1326826.1 O-succinylbenzoate synthase [Leucobacter exalbidus]
MTAHRADLPTAPPLEPTVLPALADVLARARVVAIPTRTSFRGVTVREAVIIDGPQGPTEFSPFLEYADEEAAAWLAAALDFGWHEQPAARRENIDVNATVPAVAAHEVPAILARFPGCRTAKVKVAERGQTLADDVARVRAVREAMGPDALVRVDANCGWSVDEAVTALTALAEFDLDYAEQPCTTVDELVEVRAQLVTLNQRVPGSMAPLVRIAADESVRKASDPLAVARSGAADLLIIKAQPLGGVRRALEIVEQAGLPVVVSSALDTSVGIAMGLQLAAALPEGMLAGACGLGTVALLAGDVTRDSLVPADGAIAVRRPVLDDELLTKFEAAPDRDTWWRDRVARCHAILANAS